MSTQLSFSLRTSTNVKTVHLLGSWDSYTEQLPLCKDSSKAGSWKGNFRFQSSMLKPGQRYWYYYIMDGYHVSHDPAKPSTIEPTTGRKLNVLDVPKSGNRASAPSSRRTAPSHTMLEIPLGRGLSPSRIIHPKPSKPYASRAVREADYSTSPVDDLTGQLEKSTLYSPYSISPPSSVGSSLSSRSSGKSSPSSLSSLSDNSRGSRCSCKRFGITRKGEKILIDCGGSRCGYSDDSSSGCSSSETNSEIDSSEESDSGPVRRGAPIRKGAALKPRIQTIAPKRTTASSKRR